MARRTVAFDANAFLLPVEHGVDVFDEVERLLGGFEAVVPREVAREVEGFDVQGAGLARDLLDECRVVDVDGAGYGDDAVVALAGDVDAVVTNDVELKNRLLKEGVTVLHLRGDNRLGITEA
ncbi:MAG: PIN domain-containing protein [Halobacteriales archaeon]